MLSAHSSHLFLPPGTSCLAHCPGRLELQCSCFAGGSLKYSDTTYRNICDRNVHDIRITGCWGVSGVFLGLARLSFSVCLPGNSSLLLLSHPWCPFSSVLLERRLWGTSLSPAKGHSRMSLCPGLWDSWQQVGLGPVFWLQKSRDDVPSPIVQNP